QRDAGVIGLAYVRRIRNPVQMAYRTPDSGQAVTHFFHRHDQRRECRCRLRGQFRYPRAVLGQHPFERRARVDGFDAVECGEIFKFQQGIELGPRRLDIHVLRHLIEQAIEVLSISLDPEPSRSRSSQVASKNYDLISVGGGSGGLACAQRAAEYGAKAAVIEQNRLGGTCVNVGCVPKKVMWNAAGISSLVSDAQDYGFSVMHGGHDWTQLKAKRDAYIARLNANYARNLAAKGIDRVDGTARFLDAHSIEVGGKRMTAQHIVIATGGKPLVPPLPGSELGITSDGFFEIEDRPQRVAVVGSGYIACELAGAFRELGS